MFRELARKKQKLSMQECIRILQTEKRGVLSVHGEHGYPYGMPMNHWYNAEDGKLYFHCGMMGHRLDALQKNDKVSFCTYDSGVQEPGHWALNIKSVIVFGTMEIVDDQDRIADIAKKLSYKFTDDEQYIQQEIRKFSRNTRLLVLNPEHICGKQVQES